MNKQSPDSHPWKPGFFRVTPSSRRISPSKMAAAMDVDTPSGTNSGASKKRFEVKKVWTYNLTNCHADKRCNEPAAPKGALTKFYSRKLTGVSFPGLIRCSRVSLLAYLKHGMNLHFLVEDNT